ncbi:transcriptional regulator NosR [Ketobacter alkanivorans]|uniref:Regulatory protein NosR n=1 Tax=Ketobacter alkanivorans TaxID=1917421 RepID=A0A2K9LJV6_9GAMM|nr:NosR/NirI family protein [Ketobacter alkanivorans]AUM12451.1 regulatory protein NosR [Ketobacter alkanivorans]
MLYDRLRKARLNILGLIAVAHVLIIGPVLAQSESSADQRQKLLTPFGNSATLGPRDDTQKLWPILNNGDVVGYGFETNDQVKIPAYSGKPINILMALDLAGTIKTAWVLSHHEPILLVGIPEQKLWNFARQYEGMAITDSIRVGHSSDTNTKTVDAVTGATVTIMVVHEAMLRSAKKVAKATGMLGANVPEGAKPIVIQDHDEAADWNRLTGNGALRRLHLTRAEVDTAFIGTEAEGIDIAPEDQQSDTFIDLYYGYLNIPTIGRNLLGDAEYTWLMGEMNAGDHAIAVMANGDYSFKGSGYVRGGIFDRLQLVQGGTQISFRDVDYYRLNDLYLEQIPEFGEMAIFIIRADYDFDPAAQWDVELLVRRQTGPIESTFVGFTGSYQLPQTMLNQPAPSTAISLDDTNDAPLWISIWQQRTFQLVVLCISLILLTGIIFFQDWLVRYPRLLHNLRRGFLIYTVLFLGWYSLGQLSIVNVLTFSHALMGDFRWELFLMDPVIFILWGFTAATIVLWGRGIFCGWLCPFGALQELINEAARKLKVKQIELPFAVHERLWALKYIILLALFGLSLESMSSAERYAEVEPFKTTFLLVFNREWWFAGWALMLLFVSIFTRKVYCRYLCPLGAALAIPTKLRLFDWLKRRKECGDPCQLCAVECEIQAIHPDGTINANECHHCLDCQITYHNSNKCPPLINKGKKRKKANPKLIDVITT